MIAREILSPKSILIAGASEDERKPGGRVLKNLIDGSYSGKLYGLNPKADEVQGVQCFRKPEDAEPVDLAIIAVAAKFALPTIEILAKEKGVKAFVILSAGFGETDEEGAKLERKIVEIVDSVGGSLIGPNCIGVLTPHYEGVFAGPIPKLDPQGCDFVTGSGATAVFFLETAIPMGISFSSIISVGNSAQIGVEDVLAHWDETFDPKTSSRTKLIYAEQIDRPEEFLEHARSLINKGCRIAAIKSGTTDAGSRAVSSHTGAIAGSDAAADALFRKAGVVRCQGRDELAYVAGILRHPELPGPNLAVITHAGGPGVMITDELSRGGLKTPHLTGDAADELLAKLFPGSSVANPIDFLATGNAEQLGDILDFVEDRFDEVDGSVVIFGTPGLFPVEPVYKKLHDKMSECKKPIFPVLPSVVQVPEAIEYFKSFGRIAFRDEVRLGAALAKVNNTPAPAEAEPLPEIDRKKVRDLIERANDGFLSPVLVAGLLDAAGIDRVPEYFATNADQAVESFEKVGAPIVMKVVGPVHKTETGGVSLGVSDPDTAKAEFERMMKIDGAESVMIQSMQSGIEIFLGAKRDPKFGALIMCGLGGVFVEIFKDVAAGLSPISTQEAKAMIRSLKSYEIIRGARGRKGVDEDLIADFARRLNALLEAAPEIVETDINPLIGSGKNLKAVDARIKVEKRSGN